MKNRLMILGAALALLLGAGAAQAATFRVTTLADNVPGSLRAAIDQANATPGADTIEFDVNGTIVLASRLPLITDELTIDGTGRGVTISGNNSVQVMVNTSTLTLKALTVANGRCAAPLCSTGGGGVLSSGPSLTVTDSTFSGNQAAAGGGGSDGAGIIGSGVLIISNSTFTGNRAGGVGGGVYWAGSLSRMTVTNSTFFGNSSSGFPPEGAAIFVLNAAATVTHSTFADNTGGPAVTVADTAGTLALGNTIVARGATATHANCSALGGTFIDRGGNLSNDASCGFTLAGSAVNTEPQLGPLRDNGGPTWTMSPLTGSPAIGLGDNQLAIDAGLTTDQRGLPRIAPVGGTVDRGAVEVAGLYAFAGFFAPVDNDAVNVLKAGSAVPVKFSLNGYQGLAIFAAGYPASQTVACDTSTPTDAVEETVAAGGSSLTYDAASGQYKYVWKTQREWKGSCRKLTLKFSDGSTREALFKLN